MEILKSCNWIRRVPQVPNVETGIGVVIICNYELGWNQRVPHDLSFCYFGWLGRLIVVCVKVVVLIYCLGELWLLELEKRFTLFEVPNYDFAILGSARQNVGDNTIPTC